MSQQLRQARTRRKQKAKKKEGGKRECSKKDERYSSQEGSPESLTEEEKASTWEGERGGVLSYILRTGGKRRNIVRSEYRPLGKGPK